MDSTSLPSVDEAARRHFEAAWREGHPGPLEHFLPAPDHPCYQATLEELVQIELELGWKARAAGPETAVGLPPLVEGYLARFPCLNRPTVVRRLLRQEYRVRHRHGDRPAADEYRRRFPEVTLSTEDIDTAPATTGATAQSPRIPGYEILGVLGRGGMGVVYHARQLNPPRAVALKMILGGGHASADALARFRREAEAAAGLQHPNIVQVFEVGELPAADGRPSGLPFFSLEFVSGGTLAQRIAGKPQPPRAAAALLQTLAEAIHYAHERGVIHRDLKPANILLVSGGVVSGEGSADTTHHSPLTTHQPKITDFGLAKRLATDTQLTRTGEVVGTPSYMAPEQAAGKVKEVGPAADIYALGAILYELLTGRPPFLGESATETMLQVLAGELVPPRRLQPKVSRDLETICLKCLRKEPGKRYGKALDLADDLGRFLAGEPVRARPTPRWERAVKWARRRPAAAALLAVALLAALGLAGGGLWHNARLSEANDQLQAALQTAEDRRKDAEREFHRAEANFAKLSDANGRLRVALQTAEDRRQDAEREFRRAEANFAKARDVVDEMVSWVGQQRLEGVPHMEQARRDILQKALRLYQAFLREKGTDPAVRWRVGFAYARVGEIHRLLGQPEFGEKAYAEALPLLRRLVADFPAVTKYRNSLAGTLHNRALLFKDSQRYAAAEKDIRAALALRAQFTAEFSRDPSLRRRLADTQNLLGVVLWQAGRRPQAEQAYRKALALHRQLVKEYPAERSYRQVLGMGLTNLGWLLANSGRHKEAEEVYREALSLQEKLVTDFPAEPSYRQDLAGTLYNLGLLVMVGRPREAAGPLRRAHDLRAQLVADFPTRPDYRRELGLSCYSLSELLWGAGKAPEAQRLYADALAVCEKLITDFPGEASYRAILAVYQRDLPPKLVKSGRPAEAEKAYRQSLALYEKLAGKLPDIPDWQRCLGDTQTALAILAFGRHDRAEAARLLRKAVAHRRAFLKANPKDPEARGALQAELGRLAMVLLGLGAHAEAARTAGEWSGLPHEDWRGDIWAAGLLARCVPLAAKDSQLSAAQRVRQARAYGARAVELLREAQRHGFKDVPQLQREPAFESLRQRDDFRKLLAESKM